MKQQVVENRWAAAAHKRWSDAYDDVGGAGVGSRYCTVLRRSAAQSDAGVSGTWLCFDKFRCIWRFMQAELNGDRLMIVKPFVIRTSIEVFASEYGYVHDGIGPKEVRYVSVNLIPLRFDRADFGAIVEHAASSTVSQLRPARSIFAKPVPKQVGDAKHQAVAKNFDDSTDEAYLEITRALEELIAEEIAMSDVLDGETDVVADLNEVASHVESRADGSSGEAATQLGEPYPQDVPNLAECDLEAAVKTWYTHAKC